MAPRKSRRRHTAAASPIKFTKMHGLGNDFVVIDAVTQPVTLTPEQVRRIADRHFGVGCDQLLLVEPPLDPEQDFRYRIYNADGGEVGQCGNGARCFAKFVRDRNLTHARQIRVETATGNIVLHVEEKNRFRVDMGVPRFEPADIPLDMPSRQDSYEVDLDGETVRFFSVGLGNPHAVIRVDDVGSAPVARLGPRLESHPLFPERVNVGFMQVVDRGHARLRVWERGAGETLACGSGACAAAIAGIRLDLLDHEVTVSLPGGDLSIAWPGDGQPVTLSGPATTVFHGQIRL